MMHNHLPTTLFLLLLTTRPFSLVSASPSPAQESTRIVTVTSMASVPTSTSYSSTSDFQDEIMAATNFYRAEQNVTSVKWNTTSATYAANWAGKCNFKHSEGPTGENLAAGYANASASVDAWGLEREKYNWKQPGFSEATGHFTQLVWSNTTSIGCGRYNCNGANGTPGWYVVCEYYPPGNVVGDNNQYFIDNVKPQISGKPSDTLESGVTSEGHRKENVRLALVLALIIAVTIV